MTKTKFKKNPTRSNQICLEDGWIMTTLMRPKSHSIRFLSFGLYCQSYSKYLHLYIESEINNE